MTTIPTLSTPTTASASATQDAESPSAVAIEGTVAQGSEFAESEGSIGITLRSHRTRRASGRDFFAG